VKLFPNYGYYPDDEHFAPFFDAVAELNMGVLSHCGWLGEAGADMRNERWAAYYSHPGRFEMVVRTHPKTPFIMAHMGGIAGWLETIMLTTRTPNCYVDCSPGQGRLVLDKGGPMAGAVPPTKLLYGADAYNLPQSIPDYAAIMAAQGYGPHFDKIFYSNARGIFEQVGAVAKQEEAEPTVKKAGVKLAGRKAGRKTGE
jgi:predicted TIM-barrel fold metal-dependent hydrolase